MQTLEQVSVPLAGPGLVNKSSKSYGQGEFSKLTNVIITPEGTLKKRPPVTGIGVGNNILDKVIGTFGSDVLLTKYNYVSNVAEVYRSTRHNGLDTITPTDPGIKAAMDAVTGFTGTERYYYIDGVFSYNNMLYFIYVAANRVFVSGTRYTYSSRTFIVPATYNFANPEQLISLPAFTGSVYAVETANFSESYTFSATEGVVPYRVVSSFTVHKDRVLLSIRDTVYFSKSADPTKWAVADDGGFFKFPGKSIKKILTIGDLIYSIFDTSVSLVSYSQGPNIDLKITTISDGVGGEDAAVYGDTIYLLGYKHLYAVNGSNVSKLMDLNVFLSVAITSVFGNGVSALNIAYASSLKIEVWDDGIYFYQRYLKYGATDKSIYHTRYTPGGYVYRLDLNNGHISKYAFGPGGTDYRISDSAPTSPSIRNANSRLYLLHSTDAISEVFYFTKNQVFYVFEGSTYLDVPFFGMDTYKLLSYKTACTIPIEIQISNFSPDGLMYLYRKFRSLELQADLPSLYTGAAFEPELELIVEAGIPTAYAGAEPFSTSKIISEVLNSGAISPNNFVTSYRYGVNQRARSVDITIQTKASIKAYSVTTSTLTAASDGVRKVVSTLMEIVDISTLWTPTKKGPSNSSSERA